MFPPTQFTLFFWEQKKVRLWNLRVQDTAGLESFTHFFDMNVKKNDETLIRVSEKKLKIVHHMISAEIRLIKQIKEKYLSPLRPCEDFGKLSFHWLSLELTATTKKFEIFGTCWYVL